VLARQVQVDHGLFEVTMPEQHLDGAKVRASFEEMRCEAVPERMRMDVLVLQTGANSGLPTGRPQDLGRDRAARCMPSVAGKQPHRWLVPKPTPVGTQCLEQRRTEHHVPVLASLAAADMNHHPLAVDVAHLQRRDLCQACSRGIQRHEQDALKRGLCRIDQACNFSLGKDLGEVQHLLRVRRLCGNPATLEHLDVKKSQRCQPLRDRVRRKLPGAENRRLVLADMLQAKLIGGTMEVLRIMLNRADIGANRRLGVVAALQFLEHDLT
jgi:hypothetical protein